MSFLTVQLIIIVVIILLIVPVSIRERKKSNELKRNGYVKVGTQWVLKEPNATKTTITKVITDDGTDTPLVILQKRLVRGEITGQEFR